LVFSFNKIWGKFWKISILSINLTKFSYLIGNICQNFQGWATMLDMGTLEKKVKKKKWAAPKEGKKPYG
jgi:hypothetical protein